MLVAALLLVCAALTAPAEALTDRHTRTFALPAARAITLDLTIGTVRIEGSDRTDLELLVEREGPDAAALATMALTIAETPERIAIGLTQDAGATDPAIRASVVLRVPIGALIERVKVMEGRIVVERFRGTLGADIRRGPISATDVSGTLRLETGIGSVTLKNARLAPAGLLRLRAFNGDVTLQMPGAPVDARVLALALNGTIASDIPMTTRDTWGPRWSEATLGKGAPVISIDVVTGNVAIKTK